MKTRTRVLSLIMTVAMILSSLVIVIPTSVSAADDPLSTTPDTKTWHQVISEKITAGTTISFEGGTGETGDPYQIATAEQLAYLAYLCNTDATDASNSGKKYSALAYKVMTDINTREYQWVPINGISITTNTKGFTGYFDGGNFTIYTVRNDITNWVSTHKAPGMLFGQIRSATVKNVKAHLSWPYHVKPASDLSNIMAGFAASLYDDVKIDNVHVTLDVTGTMEGVVDRSPVGGFAGYVNGGGYIQNCSVGGTVVVDTANTKDTNGNSQMLFSPYFAALNKLGGGVTNCVSTVQITLTPHGRQTFLGGLAARLWANDVLIPVTNFVDANSIKTTASAPIHYGSLLGCATSTLSSDRNAAFQVEGFVSMPHYEIMADENGTTAGLANLIGSNGLKTSSTKKFTVKNAYSANGMLPDIWNVNGNLDIVTGTDDTGADIIKSVSTANTNYDLSSFAAAAFETTVADGKTTLKIPEGLYNIFAALGTVKISKNGVEPTTDNGAVNGYREFVIETTEGVASMTVTQANGETVTLYDKWDAVATPITTGTGTASNPFVIKTAEELASLAWTWNNGIGKTNTNPGKQTKSSFYYTLGDNIDISHREWTPVGAYEIYCGGQDWNFYGSFDGGKYDDNGNLTDLYTISGMTITDACPSDMPAAFFGSTRGKTTVIKNLNLTGSVVRTDTKHGRSSDATASAMLISFACGPTTVKNVHVNGKVEIYSPNNTQETNIGGIVGWGQNVYIEDCSMRGSIKSTIGGASGSAFACAGGILGTNYGYGHIYRCENHASVTLVSEKATSNSMAGGILGIASNTGTNKLEIDGCINFGKISVVKSSAGNVPAVQRLGGIVGATGRNIKTGSVSVTNCANLGDVVGTKAGNLCEFVGINELTSTSGLTFYNCYAPYAVTEKNLPMVFNNNNMTTYATLTATETSAVTGGYAHNPATADYYFEIDTVETAESAVVYVSRVAFDVYTAAGYTMSFKYNNADIAVGEKVLSDNGRAYKWTFTGDAFVKGAKAELSFVKGDDTVTPDKATWAGIYAAGSFTDTTLTDGLSIGTAEELGLLARMMNNVDDHATYGNVNVTLTTDIDLAGAEWQPIGLSHSSGWFTGSINGDNNKIFNLTLTNDSYIYTQSFIGRTDLDAKIENLTFVSPVLKAGAGTGSSLMGVAVVVGAHYAETGVISNVDVVDLDMEVNEDMQYFAAIVGYLADEIGTDDMSLIENCDVSGVIYGKTLGDDRKIGGIVGRARQGIIRNCTSSIDMDIDIDSKANHSYVGGIVGVTKSNSNSEYVTIENCTNTGDINVDVLSSTKVKAVGVGGIAGMTYGTGKFTITNCVNAGQLTGVNSTSGENKVNLAFGGISGYNNNTTVNDVAGTTTIKNCYSLTTDNLLGGGKATTETDNVAKDITVVTKEKAAIRIDQTASAELSGLRFTSYISADLLSFLKTNGKVNIVEIGTLIAPTALVDAAGMKALDKLDDEAYPEFTPVKAVWDMNATGVDENGFWKTDDEGNHLFTGSILNIWNNETSNNFNLKFTAVAYIIVAVNGVQYTLYADYDGEEGRSRCIAEIASDAYNDRSESVSDVYYNKIEDGHEKGEWSKYTVDQNKLLASYLGIEE